MITETMLEDMEVIPKELFKNAVREPYRPSGSRRLESLRRKYLRVAVYACYGADETVNIAVIASVGDETLYCCPTIARYGDRWYLVSVSSVTNSIIGLDVNHQAFACGKGSLEDILK